MQRPLVAALLAMACEGGLEPMADPEEPTIVGDETPLIAPPDNPPEDTDDPPPPSGDCYANFGYAVDFLTEVTGKDIYDSADPTRVLFQERDEGNDGTIDVTVTFDYDADGNLVTKTTHSTTLGTLLETWTHDAEGRDLLYVEDRGADGIPDHTIERTYDVNGGMSWLSVDDDGDGLANLVITWTRDENGEALTQDIDSNGDGLLDFAWDYTNDSFGRQTLANGDEDVDGVIDFVATTTYTDPMWEVGTTNIDAKGRPGPVNEIVSFERDELDRPLWEATDDQADGVWDMQTINVWDATTGQLLSTEIEIPDSPNGAIHQVMTSTYDQLGRRTSFHDQLVVDGTPTDTLYTWSFAGSCP
jgi:hypothetical protein